MLVVISARTIPPKLKTDNVKNRRSFLKVAGLGMAATSVPGMMESLGYVKGVLATI